ncbi:MAG: hypothetical protein JWP44_5237, partial [Mucilaginibacter sp.]|nr:hypothetical protein [Mucilaginibacter sp.]
HSDVCSCEPIPFHPPTVSRSTQELDDLFRKQVLSELEANPNKYPDRTWGRNINEHVAKLLEVARPVRLRPYPTEQTKALVESNSPLGDPLVVVNQHVFDWPGDRRPIEHFFKHMEAFTDERISVQVPSRFTNVASCTVKEFSDVRERFLDTRAVAEDGPWNVLDMANVLPARLPGCLTGLNCQVLRVLQHKVLSEGTAERTEASTVEWKRWKNVIDWVLLSEGGNNTAAHTDSNAFATWLTVQEGCIGFIWLSQPQDHERDSWILAHDTYTGGEWRFVVIRAGDTIIFNSGTIHSVCRPLGTQTLAFGGHFLRWTDLQKWLDVLTLQMEHPSMTNEDMTESAPKYVRTVLGLVQKGDYTELLGGKEAADKFCDRAQV